VSKDAKSLWQLALFAFTVAALIAGSVLHFTTASDADRWAWATATAVVLISTFVSVVRALSRRETGVDVVAALAMAGALFLGEYLAGAIIAVMLTGGAVLERFARRQLSALLERAPRVAHRRAGADIIDVDVAQVVLGDVVVVKPGEVVPADGIVASGTAVLDESALTGESKPAQIGMGAAVRSGGTNAGSPFELRVTASAAESTYAGIIRLVRAAEESKAPFVRLADRYAVGFLGLTLALAAFAWIAEGSPIRALAVLVVATPCPLILAAPVAIIAGVSRAAKHGIIIKGGGPLETLARAKVLLLDKTGTVTSGRPQVVAVETFGSISSDDVVRHAASVEQLSVHPFAPAILAEARSRGVDPTFPSAVREQAGTGIAGNVDGHRIAVGQLALVAPNAPRTPELRSIERRTAVEGSSSV
jgi:cation transport ATPase